MEIINGTIISCRITDTGCWYTVFSPGNTRSFFSKKRLFSLFESCEVVLVNKNCNFFLSDYQFSYEDAPLKKYPLNIIAASWFSILVEALCCNDVSDTRFINKCIDVLSSGNVTIQNIADVETSYLKISGFGEKSDPDRLFNDYFPGKVHIRRSLQNQIDRRPK